MINHRKHCNTGLQASLALFKYKVNFLLSFHFLFEIAAKYYQMPLSKVSHECFIPGVLPWTTVYLLSLFLFCGQLLHWIQSIGYMRNILWLIAKWVPLIWKIIILWEPFALLVSLAHNQAVKTLRNKQIRNVKNNLRTNSANFTSHFPSCPLACDLALQNIIKLTELKSGQLSYPRGIL